MINISHFGGFFTPVLFRVLDNTESVDPDLLKSKLTSDNDGALKCLAEGIETYSTGVIL
jgi:hypothetical protein